MGRAVFSPLGTSDTETSAAKACQIYRTLVRQGWNITRERFSRELIVTFEWCMNPVLWTYTTIHTLVRKPASVASDSPPMNPNRQRVLVVEPDAGIRHAVCWSIDQQSGFCSIPCASSESFAHALSIHKPYMILLNHNMAGRVGFKSAGAIALIEPGVPALTYSVYMDGDQMFVSTPGGTAAI